MMFGGGFGGTLCDGRAGLLHQSFAAFGGGTWSPSTTTDRGQLGLRHDAPTAFKRTTALD
jgi:hypothetical protein